MSAFIYNSPATRVLFGHGTRQRLKAEAERLNITRALVLSTRNQHSQAELIGAALQERYAGSFADAAMHTPVGVTREAMLTVETQRIDGIVAVGGGSTIGLGKAIALRTGLPQLAIATTYSGSEMTPILGQTENGVKTTLRAAEVQPDTVIYDVDLTLGLPVDISMASGLNAMAHAAEALYAPDTNPIIDLMAQEGLRALAQALPTIKETPREHTARASALYGAWLCGTCLGSVSMSLHHKLCHTLGGMFDLPHAAMHAVLLPYVIAYNRHGAAAAYERIATALGANDAAAGLQALSQRIGIPASLQTLGMPYDGIETAARQATVTQYCNPVAVTEKDVQALLKKAWHGESLA
ncbi:maleylacetate reductase [Pusillimonas sp.]|uniref:maleylacetate reductase n=1 Tax=Pusillimonas sp. TaxID=3040095 RepID=UPI0029AD3111|nr:maleylacetate reductase [Pusillimonas sp.]MDX3895058.1 maleylacetate reductase [Pusillimonas sp.]